MASPSSEVDIALAAIQAGRVPCDLETETLDFKEDRASDSDTERLLAEAAICFANTAGGTIVLGVADRIKGPAALIGTQLEPLRIKQRIFELTRPSLVVEVERLKGHANVLAIKVPQSPGIHADTQGRAYRRIATSCLPMDPDQQQRLREERGGSDWSALPSDAPVEAAIPEAIRAARHMLLTLNDDRRTLAALNDRDLFSALGVLSDDGRLNRAGKILFCASEARGADTVLY
jgi:ATP-dependent DNA helicase RecG